VAGFQRTWRRATRQSASDNENFDERSMNQRGEENMKKVTKLIVVAVAVAGLLSASNVVAQRNYDPKTVETLQGKVLSVDKATRGQGRSYGVHLTLQTDKETVAVHLGPVWYIDKQTPKIEANDIITVTGSRVTIDGKPAIIAAQVNKGNEILKLRDENGIPAWSRAGRGNQ
jgi:hypothetical protein